jgi:hypothetical protein
VKCTDDIVTVDVDVACHVCQGHMAPVRSLFAQMESVGVSPNIHSFSACLQCLGRQSVPQPRLAKCMVDDMALHVGRCVYIIYCSLLDNIVRCALIVDS